jgi:hypothetical protein
MGAGRVSTRKRVRMGWVGKNNGFWQNHFIIVKNLRRRALSSSKTGGAVLTGGTLVRGG